MIASPETNTVRVERIPQLFQPDYFYTIANFEEFLKDETYLFLRTHDAEGHYKFNESLSKFENISQATVSFLSRVLTFQRIQDFRADLLNSFNDPDIIIAPVHAYNYLGTEKKDFVFRLTSNGSNLMSLLSSLVFQEIANLKVDFGFNQGNKPTRNASSDLHRMSFPVSFKGAAIKNGSYIVFDDHVKTGSTIASLAGHIYKSGGCVKGYAALSKNPVVLSFKQRLETQHKLKSHPAYNGVASQWKNTFGYEIEELTDPETIVVYNLLEEHGGNLLNALNKYRSNPDGPFYPKPQWWAEKIDRPQVISLSDLGINGRLVVFPSE